MRQPNSNFEIIVVYVGARKFAVEYHIMLMDDRSTQKIYSFKLKDLHISLKTYFEIDFEIYNSYYITSIKIIKY